jgi:hypothetical protein
MKKAIIFSIALLWSGWVIAQCDDKGISTDPRNPNNTEKSSAENSFYWFPHNGNNNSQINMRLSGTPATDIFMNNPFWQSSSNNNSFEAFALYANSDFYPEDGWELEQIQDTSINKNRVFFEFTGSNIIFGTTPENNPLRFEGSVKYSRDFQFLHIKSVQISPLVGYEYFNYTFNNAQYKSQINSLLYGLNIALTLGKKKQFELGIQSILFNEAVKTLSNNSTLSYKQNGYEFNVYFGPNLNIKSLGVCPFALLGYTERTEYRYNTDRKSLNLKIGLQIKL